MNKARASGLLFDRTALLFLSLSPHGMEDLPPNVRSEIEQFAENRNFEQVLIVDTHNAMGKEISKEDSEDLLLAAKSTLDTLKTKESHSFKFGFENSEITPVVFPRIDLWTLIISPFISTGFS